MQIGLFYGSSTCYTEMVAEKVLSILGEDLVTLHNLADTPVNKMADYDILFFGIPTWDFGELQTDWGNSWDAIDQVDLTGKIVGLIGLGDQGTYGEWFLDAMGMLHDKLLAKGCRVVGYWPNQGYEFEASKALIADNTYFCGLALDEVTQYDQTEERLNTWLQQVLEEIAELS